MSADQWRRQDSTFTLSLSRAHNNCIGAPGRFLKPPARNAIVDIGVKDSRTVIIVCLAFFQGDLLVLQINDVRLLYENHLRDHGLPSQQISSGAKTVRLALGRRLAAHRSCFESARPVRVFRFRDYSPTAPFIS